MLKYQRGLTLIELLAVIVILGIIAAIAVPSIGNIIDNSRDKATVSEAIQIIDAAKIAKAENPETDTFEVEYGENGFIISGQDAVNIVNGEEADSETEEELIAHIDGD
ncbi:MULTISPECIES: type II secretion system protein [Metabacillus]|uniref:Prepilin-type N-terminal cleavage/methylation domain-containing protein n=2 Tax=Metabacillus TaxID=2675233 RepID=A0A179SVN4_9BACI|nr:type II secretion system protein [Metabacillus sp. KUDC1714]OAS84919.1 hypothetical protein A6K24_05250 [Metabacillus litoralis]QNF26392.1 type II secretion system protein [Metabacillus sp. KUDC1714]